MRMRTSKLLRESRLTEEAILRAPENGCLLHLRFLTVEENISGHSMGVWDRGTVGRNGDLDQRARIDVNQS